MGHKFNEAFTKQFWSGYLRTDRSLLSPTTKPAVCAGTFSLPPCLSHLLLGLSFLPRGQPCCGWELLLPTPFCAEAGTSGPQTASRSPCPRSRVPSSARRSRIGPPQPLPSTSRGHSGTPGGACTSPTFPGEPGQVVGRALRSPGRACSLIHRHLRASRESSSTQGRG